MPAKASKPWRLAGWAFRFLCKTAVVALGFYALWQVYAQVASVR